MRVSPCWPGSVRRRALAAAAVVVGVMGACAAPAAAKQFCVGVTATTCDGGSGYAMSAAGLTAAISAAAAAPGADEVRIAAGTIDGLGTLAIAGAGGLSLSGTPGGASVLRFTAGANPAIDVTGIGGAGTTLRDLTLVGPGGGIGVRQNVPASFHVLERLRISGFPRGVQASAGTTTVRDALVDLGSTANAIGVLAASSGFDAVTSERLTIVGSGAGQVGVSALSAGASANVVGLVSQSLLSLSGSGAAGVSCTRVAGSISLSVVTTAFAPAAQNSGCSGPVPSSFVSLASTSIGFVDPGAGDYRLASYSGLIDRLNLGGPGSVPATDLGGETRYVDGDGDGSAALDLGAYEYQRRPPSPPAITVGATTVAPGAVVRFEATSADPDPGDTTFIGWNFGDGTPAPSFSGTHVFAALGTYVVTATATDSTGLKASSTVTITVANAAPLPTPGLPGGGDPLSQPGALGVRVIAAPTAKIRRGTGGFSTAAASSPDAATLLVAGAATLRVSLVRLAPGRQATSRSRCLAGARKGKRCTARVAIAAVGQIPVTPGTVHLRFGGKLGGKRLPKGTYEASVVPVAVTKKRGPAATYRLTLR